jgi:ribonuclease G
MIKTLLWDAGPGEMRAGLVEDGHLTEFRVIRQRRQMALYAASEYYTARIVEHMGRGRAKVTLGGIQDAVLEQAHGLPQGTLLAVEMTRAPIPEPGRWKLPLVRPAPEVATRAEAGWHFSAEPWEGFLRLAAPDVSQIICPDAMAANEVREILGDLDLPVVIDPQAIADADFGSLIDQAVTGEFPITGGMLSIERTRAMTMIDIDGTGDPLALNRAAALEIPRLLRLLDIGGQVGIDFLALKDKAQRQEIDATLAEACQKLGPHERTAINGFGFAQIVHPRPNPSIPEILCGTTPGRLSLESRAVALLRDAGRSIGHGARQLVALPAIIDLIRQWPEETLALRSSLGVAIELVPDASATGYGHVHVSQS